jgi:hypothetical protein
MIPSYMFWNSFCGWLGETNLCQNLRASKFKIWGDTPTCSSPIQNRVCLAPPNHTFILPPIYKLRVYHNLQYVNYKFTTLNIDKNPLTPSQTPFDPPVKYVMFCNILNMCSSKLRKLGFEPTCDKTFMPATFSVKSTLSSTSEIGCLDKLQAFNSLIVCTNDKNVLVRLDMYLMVRYIYIYSQGILILLHKARHGTF